MLLRSILAASSSALAMFALAGLYTGVLAKDFIAQNVDRALLRDPPNLLLVFFGYLVLASLMVFAFRRLWPQTAQPIGSGVKLGLASGVIWLMPYSLVLFGVYKFPYAALPLDFAWALIEQGVGGLLIGLVHPWYAK
jgi:hypothetical protein